MICKICGGGPVKEFETEIREGPAVLTQCQGCGTIHLEPDGDLKEFYHSEYRKSYNPNITNAQKQEMTR